LTAGGYGWGHAKKDLLGAILDRFKNEREQFNQWMSNPTELNQVLKQGADKARTVASATLQRVREKAGY